MEKCYYVPKWFYCTETALKRSKNYILQSATIHGEDWNIAGKLLLIVIIYLFILKRFKFSFMDVVLV